MQSKSNKTMRLWILYGMFFAIMLICIGLFFSNLIGSADSDNLKSLNEQLTDMPDDAYLITDVHLDNSKDLFNIPVYNTPTNQVSARMKSIDVLVNKTDISCTQIHWVMALQIGASLMFIAIFILVILILCSFYKAIRHGRIFQRRSIMWIRLIGILMITMSLSVDTAAYLERGWTYLLLNLSPLTPQATFTLHFTRLFFGLIILFVAEILKLGYDMQEEQDLTI